MLSWLTSIGNSIGVLVQFITSMISGIISVFSLMAQSMAFLALAYNYLPVELVFFVVVGLSIVVVFQFIGR